MALLLASGVTVRAAESPNAAQTRAIEALAQDVKKDPNNSELWLHLGFAYRKTNHIDQAQSAFEKAVSLNPHAKDANFMLGIIYESKHMTAEAEMAWENYMAAETDPEKRAIAEKHIHHLSQ